MNLAAKKIHSLVREHYSFDGKEKQPEDYLIEWMLKADYCSMREYLHVLRIKRERIGNFYDEGRRNEVIGELAEFLKESKEADHNDGFLKD